MRQLSSITLEEIERAASNPPEEAEYLAQRKSPIVAKLRETLLTIEPVTVENGGTGILHAACALGYILGKEHGNENV